MRTFVLILAFFGVGIGLIFAGAILSDRIHYKPTPLDDAIAKSSRIISSPKTNENQRAVAYYTRARAYRLQGKPDAAAADYQAMLQIEPGNSAFASYARAELIGTYIDKRDYVAAMAEWHTATNGHLLAPTDILIRGVIYTDMGDYADAENDLDNAETKLPTSIPIHVARYQLYLAEGDYNKALAALDRVQQLAPYYPSVHSLRAWVYLHELDFADAWHEYSMKDEAIKTQSQLVAIVQRLHQETANLQIDAAIADCTNILAARPGAWHYRLERGELYSWKGETDRALADIRFVEQDQPVSPQVHGYMSDVYFGAFRFADAAREDKAAAAFSENPSSYKRSRATSEFALGNYQDAATDFSAAFSSDPQDAYSVIWLHLTRMRMHTDDKAEFAKNAAALTSTEWPRPIVDYMLGNIDALALTAAANNGSLSGALRDQNCEADYYTGILALDRGDKDTGFGDLRSAAHSCHPGFIEYTMSKWALQQARATQ
jgi:lipoprotein NlpI